MNPPAMAGSNLALRFGLELSALAGLGVAAWTFTPGPARWLTLLAVPLAAAAAWGTFNVADDPSRSGAAPVPVDGSIRLGVELSVLLAGTAGFAAAGHHEAAIVLCLAVAAHYAASWSRVEWLLAN